MIYIKSPSNDPYFNLALEEYLLTQFEEEVCMLWQNDRAVIVGKNQNTLAEVNYDFVTQNNIAVVRRLTGGGAVFHDMGNLNFTYIVNNTEGLFGNFKELVDPVVKALASYGIEAEVSGRNDILIDGRKFSGNSQAVVNGRLLHHGTLLFHTDFEELSQSLIVNADKIKSKGVKSIKSRVANINEFGNIDIGEFSEKIALGTPYALTDEDMKAAEKLKAEKYGTWEWNYGYSPVYNFHNQKRLSGGSVEVYIDVVDGKMQTIKIYGDFFAARDTADIEKALKDCNHDKDSIVKALEPFSINEYFSGISVEELTTVFF